MLKQLFIWDMNKSISNNDKLFQTTKSWGKIRLENILILGIRLSETQLNHLSPIFCLKINFLWNINLQELFPCVCKLCVWEWGYKVGGHNSYQHLIQVSFLFLIFGSQGGHTYLYYPIREKRYFLLKSWAVMCAESNMAKMTTAII